MEERAVIKASGELLPSAGSRQSGLPELVLEAGEAARFAWEEFVFGRLRNVYTRRNYRNAVQRFLAWCGQRRVELQRITPKDVGDYIDQLTYAPATKQLHLAALRSFFDDLVVRHVVILNPAASVRGERYQVMEGKTPEISAAQVRELLQAIDTTSVVGLRDRAVIAVLIYTAARVGAVAKLDRRHFYDVGDQYCLRFAEKSGKSREIPVRHDLSRFLREYLQAAGLEQSPDDSPLFRTAPGRAGALTESRLTSTDMGRMFKRRLQDAGLPTRFCPHSLRVCAITNLLEQNLSLADVQNLAGHADPRTTRLYDRRHRRVTRNIVERIAI